MANVYQENGYASREEYLESLREDYGSVVDTLTSVLPASEDFDGLLTALEDYEESSIYDSLNDCMD
jgi:hypothetical protein